MRSTRSGQLQFLHADRAAFTRMTELKGSEFARAKMGISPGPLPAPGSRSRKGNETLH